MRIRVGVTIDATPAVVWRTVEPIERHVDWMTDAATITFTGRQTRGVGTAFDCLTKVGPFRLVDRMVVTEWAPAKTMGIEHRGVVSGRGRFTLRPHPIHVDRAAAVPVVDGRTGRCIRRPARAPRALAP